MRTKNKGESGYSMQGVGLVHFGNFDKKTKIEWQSTDKELVLPYKTIF